MRNNETKFSHEDVTALSTWLVGQRWYGEKSRILESVEIDTVSSFELEDGRYLLVIAKCAFSEGAHSSYLVPIKASGSPGSLFDSDEMRDAFLSEPFLHWLIAGFGEARILRSGHGTELTWNPYASFPDIVGDCRLLGAEQTNTSVLFGQQAIGKVFRRLLEGTNPDPEMVGYLTRGGNFAHVPSLLGTVTIDQPHVDAPITIAAVQTLVTNQGDCWTWLLAELSRLPARPGADLVQHIRLLGRRTGELHMALAVPTEDENFAPETISNDDTDRMRATLAAEISETIAMVRRSRVRPDAAATSLGTGLSTRLEDVRQLAGYPRTRVHGDYHLGQVLKTTDDFVIIDFEGEPSRPMNMRRAKASPLKDVAGMIRSFDYAVATVAMQAGSPTHEADIGSLGRTLRETFLAGYLDAVKRSSPPLVPPVREQFEHVLETFIIEKALYEVRYELDNRPAWVEIPLRAVEATLG